MNRDFLAFILSALIIFAPACACKTQVVEDVKEIESPKIEIANDPLKEDFRREGFISNNVFRVVIVEPKTVHGVEDVSSIMKTSKKRAYLTLKKYLISNDRIVTGNVDASLINLIEQEGKLSTLKDTSPTRTVYYFELNKSNIKGYVEGLAPRR